MRNRVEVRYSHLVPIRLKPGAIHTADPKGELSARFGGAPPEVPAAVVAWLATDPAAVEWNGKTVSAQKLCLKLGLQPDWR